MTFNFTRTFDCYNQFEHTKNFIVSLDSEAVEFSCIVVADNASADDTRELLIKQGSGIVVLSDRSLGCSAAWSEIGSGCKP